MRTDTKARQRTTVILEVQSGRITATEGARRLGVSRKTYYEWEIRALQALVQALTDETAGRPPRIEADPEKDDLRRQVQDLQRQLEAAKQTEAVRRVLTRYEERLQARGRTKKNTRCVAR